MSEGPFLILEKKGLKEVCERQFGREVEQPSLNKKGGLRFLLSHAWDRALKDIPRRLSHGQSTGSQA